MIDMVIVDYKIEGEHDDAHRRNAWKALVTRSSMISEKIDYRPPAPTASTSLFFASLFHASSQASTFPPSTLT